MATKPKAKSLEDLVTEAWDLKKRIRADQEKLKEIEVQIIAQGGGSRAGRNGAECAVIIPNPGIKPTDADIAACRKVLGSSFNKLFVEKVTFTPVEAFRQVAAALLTAAKFKKVLAIVEKAGSSFVKWPK